MGLRVFPQPFVTSPLHMRRCSTYVHMTLTDMHV